MDWKKQNQIRATYFLGRKVVSPTLKFSVFLAVFMKGKPSFLRIGINKWTLLNIGLAKKFVQVFP